MSRSGIRSERRAEIVVLAAALSLLASACPLSDSYQVDGDGEGGGSAQGGTAQGGAGPIAGNATSTGTSLPAGGADECGPTEAPPGGACPEACSRCSGATCIIECDMGPGANCNTASLTCPAGFACEVYCNAKDACKDASVSCPAGYSCHVFCDDEEACKNMDIACNGGDCLVSCNDQQGCKDTHLMCGEGDNCSCDGFAQPLQTSGCDSACSCTGCE